MVNTDCYDSLNSQLLHLEISCFIETSCDLLPNTRVHVLVFTFSKCSTQQIHFYFLSMCEYIPVQGDRGLLKKKKQKKPKIRNATLCPERLYISVRRFFSGRRKKPWKKPSRKKQVLDRFFRLGANNDVTATLCQPKRQICSLYFLVTT